MKKLIQVEAIDIETLTVDCILKTVKDGDEYILANDNSVMWHEDMELADSFPEVMGVPCSVRPQECISLFRVGGEYRIYDANMNLIDSSFDPELLVQEYFNKENDDTDYIMEAKLYDNNQ